MNTVRIVRETSAPLPPPPSRPLRRPHRDYVTASFVLVLTLACTALAVFDLFLLASGLSS